MKKIVIIFTTSFMLWNISVYAFDSTVQLPGGGNAAPAQTVSLPLTGLVAQATYQVICYLTTTTSGIIVRFGNNLGVNDGMVSSYTLNGVNVTQGQLIPGSNIAVITGQFNTPATAQLTFTNLDQTNTFNINSCYAMAVVG